MLDADTCPKNTYKPVASSAGGGFTGAALAFLTTGPVASRCYEDCNKVYLGLENCGWWACASNSVACGGTIAEMSLDILTAGAKAASFAVSFGLVTPGTAAISAAKNSLKSAA
jgi:hypothetical protein